MPKFLSKGFPRFVLVHLFALMIGRAPCLVCHYCGVDDECPPGAPYSNGTCQGNLCSKESLYEKTVKVRRMCIATTLMMGCFYMKSGIITVQSQLCVCDVDLCNGSSRLSPPNATLLIVLAVVGTALADGIRCASCR